MMKRIACLILVVLLFCPLIASCDRGGTPTVLPWEERPRLSAYVGVWTNAEESRYYRFTPESRWYCYNVNGQVEADGSVSFDGKTFTLAVSDDSEPMILTVQGESLVDGSDVLYHRTDSPSSLISSAEYGVYFSDWFEESDLSGNVLTILEPDTWQMKDPAGTVLAEGSFYAYANEPEHLYLYSKDSDNYYARLSFSDPDVILERQEEDRVDETVYSSRDNSRERMIYFREKGVSCDYQAGSGYRLLRNGGAAYNDAHDYKKMPVTCRIDVVLDRLLEDGTREMEILVVYDFKRTDLPYLSGGVFYNSVRFSQYDYYTGELFYLDDSTGKEDIPTTWVTTHDDEEYRIDCLFSSQWQYSGSDEILARWQGTYRLVIPADYDGFVICLRPVFNSYAAQVSSSAKPMEGTLMTEDVGDDVKKSVFCRIPRFTKEVLPEEAE